MKIKRGSTSVRRLIFVADSSSTTGAGLANLAYNTASLVAYYFAGDLSNEVQITLATATLGTFASGGFVAVDNTNMPGWYEIGIPDAALDGGNECAIQFRGAANMVPVNVYIELDAFDYQTATQPVNVTQISGDSTAADNAEAFFDGTGYAGTNNVIPTVTTLTNLPAITAGWLTAAGIAADAITAAKIADGAIDTATFAVGTTIPRVTLVDTTTTNTDMRGTDNAALAATALSTAVWTGALATNIGTTNTTVATNLDATITSRMATYTQPTGFLAASFPTDPADQSIIIAATDAILTAVGDVPTNAELATALGTADDVTLAAIASEAVKTAAIKVKTDQLTFTTANKVDSTAVLDSASVTAVQTGLATSASITALRGADNDTLKTLSDQIDGISSGGTDWTANERTAIRSILGVPASGTTPADPTVGILDTIRDSVGTYIAGISAVASTTTGTIVGFPSSLNIGDSYTEEANSDIHVFIRDENDDPITAVGDFNFTDPEFAPEVNITQSGSTGRVKAVVTFVNTTPEDYLKVEIPTSQSRRASPGTATIQCLLKWVDTEGKVLAQKTLTKQAVTWNEMV